MSYFVYILHSEKLDKYYVGYSKNPNVRLRYHNGGKMGWTKRGIPWKIVFKKSYNDKKTAMEKEKFIKRQKSSSYIKKLINNDYEL